MTRHYKILIVGGGAAGISVAAALRRKDRAIEIAIIEPSEVHYYQPAFTVVGGGAYDFRRTMRAEASLIPADVHWIKDAASEFDPSRNSVGLRSGASVTYDFLVLCPGIQLDWHKIAGLPETLGAHGVCSNYSPDTVRYTWDCIRTFETGGTALFTQPPMPIKCAGAPQKIMYLAADRFRRRGLLERVDVQFCTAGPAMFGIPFFARELDKVADSYHVQRHFHCNLIAVDGPAKTATFEQTLADGGKSVVTRHFSMLHVTPPQSAPDFIKRSPFADEAGWINVNKATLQQTRFSNVFGLGDATNTPNAKTAAAVRKQVPVVVKNVLSLAQGHSPLDNSYDGYGSCPLTTSLHAVILAEFAYDGRVTPSFPWLDPRKGRYLWWLGKKHLLPLLYWDYMLKGAGFDIPHRQAYVQDLLATV